jgi:hypothetical protein
VVLFTEALCSR